MRVKRTVLIATVLLAGCGGGGGGQTDADAWDEGVDTAADDAGWDGEAADEDQAEVECSSDGDCDDANPCTADACDLDYNTCSHEAVDADGDGYPAMEVGGSECAGGTDCDDEGGAVFPGAPIVPCSPVDHDCNGEADEDNDGDGHLDDACASGDDCDDGDPGVHGGAAVVPCSTVDHDCNGSADEDDDGDGVLDAACGGDDCDDADPLTHAGAAEICADWIDEDCDGSEDDLGRMTSNVRLTVAAGESGYSSAAWTGSEIGVAWHDERDGNFEIYFGRVAIDGTRVGTDTRITNASNDSWEPGIAWTGSEFGVVWEDARDTNYEIYFARISATGVKQGSDVRISNAAWYSLAPVVAWGGSQYGLGWADARDGNNEIYFARVSAAGAKQGADVRITSTSGQSTVPTIAWSGSEFGLAWYDDTDGDNEIYFARVSAGGVKQGGDVQITSYMRDSLQPSILWTGSEYGLAWSDARDLNPEIYFVRITGGGAEAGLETRITFSSGESLNPSLAWTGSEFVVAWQDDRDGNQEEYFARFSAEGLKSGLDERVTTADGDSAFPALVGAGVDLGLVWHDARDGNYEVYYDRLSFCE